MSYERGMAAINLEMTDRVPRTEYSFERHWPLVEHETGIKITTSSTPEERRLASQAMFKAWDIDFKWNVMHIHDTDFTKLTKMGHAEFEGDGSDYDKEGVVHLRPLKRHFPLMPTKNSAKKILPS